MARLDGRLGITSVVDDLGYLVLWRVLPYPYASGCVDEVSSKVPSGMASAMLSMQHLVGGENTEQSACTFLCGCATISRLI